MLYQIGCLIISFNLAVGAGGELDWHSHSLCSLPGSPLAGSSSDQDVMIVGSTSLHLLSILHDLYILIFLNYFIFSISSNGLISECFLQFFYINLIIHVNVESTQSKLMESSPQKMLKMHQAPTFTHQKPNPTEIKMSQKTPYPMYKWNMFFYGIFKFS